MKIAISQPTYIPWQGYFGLIDFVDEFVFLENVQFIKRSWQQRNKIRDKNKEIMLSIPVESKNKYHQKIYEVKLFEFEKTRKKHIQIIKSNYSKSKYFKIYFPNYEKIMNKNYSKLSDLNKSLIIHFCEELKIKTKITTDTAYNFKSKNINYLKDICLKKKGLEYISTLGSKNYLGDLIFFPNSKIKIRYFNFKDMEYVQSNNNFLPKLSILDLLFNLGPDSLKYLRNNFYLCN